MNEKCYKNGLSNFQQLLDPWDYIRFLKNETTLEKKLEKLQNLTLYNTNLIFLYIIADFSLTHVSLITLNCIDPRDEKKPGILHKKNKKFFLGFQRALLLSLWTAYTQ